MQYPVIIHLSWAHIHSGHYFDHFSVRFCVIFHLESHPPMLQIIYLYRGTGHCISYLNMARYKIFCPNKLLITMVEGPGNFNRRIINLTSLEQESTADIAVCQLWAI
jgi:hypothetical protein